MRDQASCTARDRSKGNQYERLPDCSKPVKACCLVRIGFTPNMSQYNQKTHLVTIRVPPNDLGLFHLYHQIKIIEPQNKETRHLETEALQLMHRHWSKALREMHRQGCIEWRVSQRLEDLPVRLQTQSVRRALI